MYYTPTYLKQYFVHKFQSFYINYKRDAPYHLALYVYLNISCMHLNCISKYDSQNYVIVMFDI